MGVKGMLANLRDVEKRLGFILETLYAWIKSGRVTATRLRTGRYPVREEDLRIIEGMGEKF